MRLTIFTPTYNRGYCIKNLYDSLKRQNYSDFEWIVVDDESSDNTAELFSQWSKEANFEIHYFRQSHGGKHRAINKGVSIAQGDYFFIVDSDDWITDDAVEYIYKWIDETKSLDNLCGFSGLRFFGDYIIGGKPNMNGAEYIDATNLERDKYNLSGDKAEIYKTSILKQFPLPEFENEYFVTEAVCWNAIANAGYKVRWYNKPIYICEYLPDGLTKNGANEIEGHIKNFKGFSYFVKQTLEIKGYTSSPRILKDYLLVNIKMKNNPKYIADALNVSVLTVLALPVYLICAYCRKIIEKGLHI